MHPTLLFYSMGINFGFALWKNYLYSLFHILLVRPYFIILLYINARLKGRMRVQCVKQYCQYSSGRRRYMTLHGPFRV